MNEARMYKVILGPHTTEKSVRMADKSRQIAFQVALDATKGEVKMAIQRLFSVIVDEVRMCRVKGKHKQFKQMAGKRKDIKKAYVTLAEGYDIKVADFQ